MSIQFNPPFSGIFYRAHFFVLILSNCLVLNAAPGSDSNGVETELHKTYGAIGAQMSALDQMILKGEGIAASGTFNSASQQLAAQQEELKKALDEAVEKGELTKKEAEEKYAKVLSDYLDVIEEHTNRNPLYGMASTNGYDSTAYTALEQANKTADKLHENNPFANPYNAPSGQSNSIPVTNTPTEISSTGLQTSNSNNEVAQLNIPTADSTSSSATTPTTSQLSNPSTTTGNSSTSPSIQYPEAASIKQVPTNPDSNTSPPSQNPNVTSQNDTQSDSLKHSRGQAPLAHGHRGKDAKHSDHSRNNPDTTPSLETSNSQSLLSAQTAQLLATQSALNPLTPNLTNNTPNSSEIDTISQIAINIQPPLAEQKQVSSISQDTQNTPSSSIKQLSLQRAKDTDLTTQLTALDSRGFDSLGKPSPKELKDMDPVIETSLNSLFETPRLSFSATGSSKINPLAVSSVSSTPELVANQKSPNSIPLERPQSTPSIPTQSVTYSSPLKYSLLINTSATESSQTRLAESFLQKNDLNARTTLSTSLGAKPPSVASTEGPKSPDKINPKKSEKDKRAISPLSKRLDNLLSELRSNLFNKSPKDPLHLATRHPASGNLAPGTQNLSTTSSTFTNPTLPNSKYPLNVSVIGFPKETNSFPISLLLLILGTLSTGIYIYVNFFSARHRTKERQVDRPPSIHIHISLGPTGVSKAITPTHSADLKKSKIRLKPNHTYVLYDKTNHYWVMVHTNKEGQLYPPIGKMLPGSVVSSSVLGLSENQGNFRLGTDNHWAPTHEKESYQVDFYTTWMRKNG